MKLEGEVQHQRADVVSSFLVAILPIMTASPMASAGRFSPRGPFGILHNPYLRKIQSLRDLLSANLGQN